MEVSLKLSGVAGDESGCYRAAVFKAVMQFLSKIKLYKDVEGSIPFETKYFPLHLIQQTDSEGPWFTTRSCGDEE